MHEIMHAEETNQARTALCPACNSGGLHIFHRVEDVPTNSCILLDTAEEAISYPTGDIALGVCQSCGFISNTAFEPEKTEYSGRYEETQGFSPTFNRFHENLAKSLIEKYDLRSKTILEIGCGKGEFLALLAELGDNVGIGVDPGVKPERIDQATASRIKFIADFYSEKYGDLDADFLACKMTLEHIPDVENFLRTVRRGLGNRFNTVVFFQVPEALRILRECAFEDIYYEHCSYFTPASLARAFRSVGFDVIDISIEYSNQYLTIEARPRGVDADPLPSLPAEESVDEVMSLITSFETRCAAKVQAWRKRVRDAVAEGKTIAIWGSGSKAVSFMTTCDLGACISAVTDVNPHRHGHYMPKTGHRIVAPDELKQIRPDFVIVMNGVYEAEIRRDLGELGLQPEIAAL